MDFSLPGKLLPGNIYKQFESICWDVDEFVTKDTMKFVEDRVKRFYSDMVLPLSGDNVKSKSQLLDAEQVGTNSTSISEKQVFLNNGSTNTLRDSDASLPIEFDHINHTEPPCGDLSPGAETYLHLGECSDAITQNGEESSVEISEPLSGASNEDHKHTLGDYDASLPIKVYHINHVLVPPCGDLSPGPKTSLHLGECSNAITQNGEESGVDISAPPSGASNEDDHKHTFGDYDASLPIKFDCINQLSVPPCKNLSPGLETSLHLGEFRNAITHNGEESGVEIPEPPSGTTNEDHKHTLGDFDASLPIKFVHLKQISEPPCGDLSLGAENSLHLGECSNAITGNGEESGVEEAIVRDSIPLTTNSCLNNEVFSGVSNDDREEDLTYIKDETQHFNLQKGNKSDFHDFACHSNSKITFKEEWNRYSDEYGSLSSPSVSLANKVNEDNSLFLDSPLASAYDANASALLKEKEVMMGITSSCCCIMEPTSAVFIMKAEYICPVHSETKDVDELPFFLILKSNDNNVIQTDGSELVNASSDGHRLFLKVGHPEMLISPSETADTCEFSENCGDFDMETVDLSSDLKDYATILVSKRNCVHATPHKRNFRYYKKLIRDAFTSQKRISKEYEHLAILYGDIDFAPSCAPLVLNTHAVETRSVTEWEMI